MPCTIHNVGLNTVVLPYPLRGFLGPGNKVLLNATAAAVMAEIGTPGNDSTLKIQDVVATSGYDTFAIGNLSAGFDDPGGATTLAETALSRLAAPCANETAIKAIAAADRTNGMLAVDLTNDALWVFDSASSATASSWVLVPAAGTGRWLSVEKSSSVIAAASASETTIKAIAATARTDGMLVVDMTNNVLWVFDAGSSAGASAWVLVPDAGTGRWIRNHPSLADFSAVTGAALVGSNAAGYVGATVATQLAEVKAIADVATQGVPMQNRLRLLGAPGAAVEGNTVTIGADVYEFRGSTPPSGGTAGRIWVYNGADSAASRANLINAINNFVDAATITYDGAVTETFLAAAGVTTGDVVILSADAAGGTPEPSATATACADGLDTATDIWDSATCLYGEVATTKRMGRVAATIGAEELAKGTLDVFFDFTPSFCYLHNRSRQQNEAYVISGDGVSLTLAGGATPNNQSGDVIDILVIE